MSEGSLSAVAKSDGGIKCKLGEEITFKASDIGLPDEVDCWR